MTILEKINTDFITAFKNKDINQKNFLGKYKTKKVEAQPSTITIYEKFLEKSRKTFTYVTNTTK